MVCGTRIEKNFSWLYVGENIYLQKKKVMEGKDLKIARKGPKKKQRTHQETGYMNPIESLFGHDTFTIVLGILLMLGVLAFTWFDYRRTSRLPHLGTVMVKNRLKSSN